MGESKEELAQQSSHLPLLVLAPHSSGHIPADILKQVLGQQLFDTDIRNQRLQHIFNEGDPYTDLIFHIDNAYFYAATVSRFVVDVNRFRDDISDNGVIKVVDFGETPLYPEGYILTEAEREKRLVRYFDSFHATVEQTLKTNSIKLMISGHSMSTFGPNLGPDKGKARPAICLMTGGDIEGNDVEGQRNFLGGEKARAVKALAEKHFETIIQESNVPKQVTLNDPWAADVLSHTYTNPELSYALPCFGMEFNHALCLNTDKTINSENVKTLNQCFSNFAEDCLKLFS